MKKKPILTLYGSVGLIRKWCSKCNAYSIVLDGKKVCCDQSVKRPSRAMKKRMGEGRNKRVRLPKKMKDKIFKKQDNKCFYCGVQFGKSVIIKEKERLIRPVFDHFVAWTMSRDNRRRNMVASCQICNGMKSDKYFGSELAARRYLHEKSIERGYETLPGMWENL